MGRRRGDKGRLGEVRKCGNKGRRRERGGLEEEGEEIKGRREVGGRG